MDTAGWFSSCLSIKTHCRVGVALHEEGSVMLLKNVNARDRALAAEYRGVVGQLIVGRPRGEYHPRLVGRLHRYRLAAVGDALTGTQHAGQVVSTIRCLIEVAKQTDAIAVGVLSFDYRSFCVHEDIEAGLVGDSPRQGCRCPCLDDM